MKQEIYSLQLLRGLAAISVAFYHTHLIIMQYSKIDILGTFALHGKSGVNIFFTISGFIILKAHWNDISKPSSIPNYLRRRFVRVYPLYWVLSAFFMLAAYMGLGKPDFSWAFSNLVSSGLLYEITPDVTPPLKVAWTLFYEIKFYLAFIILMISRVAGIVFFGIWSALVIYQTVTTGVVDAGWLSPWILYFIAGMLIYIASIKISRSYWIYTFLLTAILTTIYLFYEKLHITYSEGDILPSLIWLIPTCAFMLLTVALYEKPQVQSRRGFWIKMGDASYSIYLVHSAVISVFAIVGKKLGLFDIGGGYPLFAVTFAAAVMGGYIVHLAIEVPLLKFFRRSSPPKV